MTVETTTLITGLNSAWPAGTDPKSEGDDHLRLLKSVLKADFDDSVAGQMAFPGRTVVSSNIAGGSWNGGPVGEFRNKLINGDFLFWQRATTQSTSGYGSDDRWLNFHAGSTKVHQQQNFTLGQTAVPGNPSYFSRTVVTSVAGANNGVSKTQKIEGVQTLSGLTATLSFYAKADASKNIAVEFIQSFGTGGSPSADVNAIGVTTIALTTSWARYNVLVTLPSISGKTLGSNLDGSLQATFWFDAGSSFNARTNALGQQSGTFDISHVSLVQGDARTETDPFSPRHQQQELALCQRYYEQGTAVLSGYGTAGIGCVYQLLFSVSKRAVPTLTYGVTASTNVTTFDARAPTLGSFRWYCSPTAAGAFIWDGTWTATAEL
jgi:hypothetical protein